MKNGNFVVWNVSSVILMHIKKIGFWTQNYTYLVIWSSEFIIRGRKATDGCTGSSIFKADLRHCSFLEDLIFNVIPVV